MRTELEKAALAFVEAKRVYNAQRKAADDSHVQLLRAQERLIRAVLVREAPSYPYTLAQIDGTEERLLAIRDDLQKMGSTAASEGETK